MLTLKFGGTSMANASRILSSANIILERSKKARLCVVVSAVAGISNKLQAAIDEATSGANAHSASIVVDEIRKIHLEICTDIEAQLSGFSPKKVMSVFESHFLELERLLQGTAAFGECTDTVYCRIMGTGELLSSAIMNEVLVAKGLSVQFLDSRNFVFTTGNQKEGEADYARCEEACKPYRDGGEYDDTHI
ncbi:MAG: bifunctional aspartate kinase/homoserine dehydrogenase I, partial [Treponemataceae bacterium]|nr:bifunctional aspartate kinase/homoserine dehydrogenase I [Treponemataceae bacterium]